MLAERVAKSPVVPIPPPFGTNGALNYNALTKYLKFLHNNGTKTIMTTAGTSQFNLMTSEEILTFNELCAKHFPGDVILGIPPGNTIDSKVLIQKMNFALKLDPERHAIMPLYPDRYYDDDSIVEYFHELAEASEVPLFIHGMWMRNGTGGTYDYSAALINKIAAHQNIVGMKEETTDYAKAYNVLKDVDKDFVAIVAGGSMRRFMLLCNSKPNVTFLAGIGNLYPRIENEFIKQMNLAMELAGGAFGSAQHLLKTYEDPFFDGFMKVGWHRALRYALQMPGMPYEGTTDRKPFASLTGTETVFVKTALMRIEKKLKTEKEYDNE